MTAAMCAPPIPVLGGLLRHCCKDKCYLCRALRYLQRAISPASYVCRSPIVERQWPGFVYLERILVICLSHCGSTLLRGRKLAYI
eukprot:2578682-Amphidinium_carterae.1